VLKHISGFSECSPGEQIVFQDTTDKIRRIFERYGYIPLDTAAVERLDSLMAKGNDKEIYGLYRIAAQDGEKKERDMGLRFDLTVPLARYVAQNFSTLTFPYRRYQIAPVWRGERPQAGRSRQFTQCDIDVISQDRLSLAYDAEVITMAQNVFQSLGLQSYTGYLSNRKLLSGLLEDWGVPHHHTSQVLRTIDKVHKVDFPTVAKTLEALDVTAIGIQTFQEMLAWPRELPQDTLRRLKDLAKSPLAREGLEEIDTVIGYGQTMGMDQSFLKIDPTLARGLTYYTGTIYEARLNDYPQWGSICGGGRYDNLTKEFGKQVLPGVGLSIGLTRLIPMLIQMGILEATRQTNCKVLVSVQDPSQHLAYSQMAAYLRENHIPTELDWTGKPLAHQLKYAQKKGFPFVFMANQEELLRRQGILKNFLTGHQETLSWDQIVQRLKD
jgi:histidyl-tRNA synthetase